MSRDIISQLKTLKSVQADSAWVSDNKIKMRQRLIFMMPSSNQGLEDLEQYPMSWLFGGNSFASRLMVYVTSLVVILSGSFVTVGASQSSLPGDTLYPLKIATENLTLMVATETDKPKIEIEQAGRRLEELTQITQKTSDIKQEDKAQDLMLEFEYKMNSANNKLAQLNDKGKNDQNMKDKVVEVAEVISSQSEKYSEVLMKTSENMSESMKNKVADRVASATKNIEKTSFDTLLVIVETKPEQSKEDGYLKVQKKLEKIQSRMDTVIQDMDSVAVCKKDTSEPSVVAAMSEVRTVTPKNPTFKSTVSAVSPEVITDSIVNPVNTAECINTEQKTMRAQIVAILQKKIQDMQLQVSQGELLVALNMYNVVNENIILAEKGEWESLKVLIAEENIAVSSPVIVEPAVKGATDVKPDNSTKTEKDSTVVVPVDQGVSPALETVGSSDAVMPKDTNTPNPAPNDIRSVE